MSSTNSSTDDEKIKTKHNKKKSKVKGRHQKKEKKHKKRKKYSTSESSTSSGSEADWVEKGKSHDQSNSTILPQSSTTNTVNTELVRPSEDDNWSDFNSFIPTYSNSMKKEKRQTMKDWDKVLKSSKPGQHSRELNPYWKDGGDGLPGEKPLSESETKPQSTSSSSTVGDGGLYWLKKSYQRAKEQARKEGRSLEEVASERWGSLSRFYAMLEEAEDKAEGRKSTPMSSSRHAAKDNRSSSRNFKKPKRDSGSDNESDKYESYHHKSKISSRSSRHTQPSWMKPSSFVCAAKNPDSTLVSKGSPPSKDSKVEQLEETELIQQEETAAVEAPKVLTDQEMNALSAKILKAEMLGNVGLMVELKTKHAEAELERQKFIKAGGDPKKSVENSVKVVTKIVMGSENRGRKTREKPSETHRDGQRVRYFPDDDKHSLQNMFQREKMNTVEDENALFSRLAGKGMKSKPTDEYDLDDIFADKASSSKKVESEKDREVRKIIDSEKFYKKTLSDCQWCFDGSKLEKNIVISMGEKSFLCVPPFHSLSEGHCLIVPMFHASASTDLDEDVWNEMQKFRHALVRMFRDKEQDMVIFETAVFLKKIPHMYLECVPMPKETGELAPIYFKKAIQECETEWSQNKKLVDLRGRDVRKAVPKGLPYFSVDFGDESGFAHVIEDEKNFPRNFAQEIIGGMMELDHSIWRKRKNDNFNDKKDKLLKFVEIWAPYDWTRDG